MEELKTDVAIGDLRCFLSVVEAGSFTSAAQSLGVTQPAVSRQVQRLEQLIGGALLDRSMRPLRLTRAGEQFRDYALAAIAAFEEALANVRQTSTAVEGELRIAASTAPGDYLLPAWLESFVALHPAVRPNVFISDSAEVVQEIRDATWDVGFVGSQPALDASIKSYAVAHDEVVLAVPAGHPFAARGEIGLDELAGQRFVVREHGSGTVKTVEDTLQEYDLSLPPLQVVMTLNTNHASLSAVQKGIGFCWTSVLGFQDGSFPGVAPVRIQGVRFLRDLYLIHSSRSLPPVATAFVRWLLGERDGR